MKMTEDFFSDVLELYNSKQWVQLVEKYHNHPDRNRVLWVFPSQDNLCFLKRIMDVLECENIISIGCGSGLLEWIITEAIGIPVIGVEIDGAWWNCKYSPPTFMPLHLCDPDLNQDERTKSILESNCNSAILFCYFNNRPAFDSYIKHFKGNVMVIIGPGSGRGTHTNPKPFNDVDDPWTLYDFQEVRQSKDYIAVYSRNYKRVC